MIVRVHATAVEAWEIWEVEVPDDQDMDDLIFADPEEMTILKKVDSGVGFYEITEVSDREDNNILAER